MRTRLSPVSLAGAGEGERTTTAHNRETNKAAKGVFSLIRDMGVSINRHGVKKNPPRALAKTSGVGDRRV